MAGDRNAEDTKDLIRCVRSHYLPDAIIIVADGRTDGFLYGRLPILKTLVRINDKATAYVCEDFACSLPVSTVEDLDLLLSNRT